MAQQTKTTLKQWFVRKAKPLASQFADWMDSYWHKDENIPIAKVEGLVDTLNELGSFDLSGKADVTYVDAEIATNLTAANDYTDDAISNLDLSVIDDIKFVTATDTLEINKHNAIVGLSSTSQAFALPTITTENIGKVLIVSLFFNTTGLNVSITGAKKRDNAADTIYLKADNDKAMFVATSNGWYCVSRDIFLDLSAKADVIYVDTQLTTKADLVGGFVPSSQLPSYVDDVLEFNNLAAFPLTGEVGKIYVAKDSNKQYRWSGSSYIQITNGLLASTADLPDSTNKRYQTDVQAANNDATSSIQTQLNEKFGGSVSTNSIPKGNALGQLIDSILLDDGTKIKIGNVAHIGGTANGYLGNLIYIVDFENTGSKALLRVNPLGATNGSFSVNHNYATGKSSINFNNLSSADFVSSLGIAGGFGVFGNNLFAQNVGFTGNILGLYQSNTDTYVFQVTNSGLIESFATNNTDNTVIHSFKSKNAVVQGSFRNGGLVLGAGSINASCALDIQSTSKGAGLPVLTNSVFSALATREGNVAYSSNKKTVSLDNGTTKVDLALKNDIPIVYEFAPLFSLVSTVPLLKVNLAGALPSTRSAGLGAGSINLDCFKVNQASILVKVGISLTDACTDAGTVASNPTVRLDLYNNTLSSRSIIATLRIPITNNAGIGTSSTLATLTAADTTFELTGLSNALALGNQLGLEFVPESGSNRICGVNNLKATLSTILA